MAKREQQEKQWMLDALQRAGISAEDIQPLRRISMTLHRWFELECGTGTDTVSESVERDETTGKPFHRIQYMGRSGWIDKRYPIADREKGAMKRLDAFRAKYLNIIFYVQSDPRGCALYAVTSDKVRAGEDVGAVYNRGIAIY